MTRPIELTDEQLVELRVYADGEPHRYDEAGGRRRPTNLIRRGLLDIVSRSVAGPGYYRITPLGRHALLEREPATHHLPAPDAIADYDRPVEVAMNVVVKAVQSAGETDDELLARLASTSEWEDWNIGDAHVLRDDHSVLAPDDDAAMEHARRVHGHSADRIAIRHGSVVLRDFDRASGVERVATGRAARSARNACGIEAPSNPERRTSCPAT